MIRTWIEAVATVAMSRLVEQNAAPNKVNATAVVASAMFKSVWIALGAAGAHTIAILAPILLVKD